MKDRAIIEQEIRQLLLTETNGTELFNKLFEQGSGLFGQLASSESERRLLVQSDLFREAQERADLLLDQDAKVLDKLDETIRQQVPRAAVSINVGRRLEPAAA